MDQPRCSSTDEWVMKMCYNVKWNITQLYREKWNLIKICQIDEIE